MAIYNMNAYTLLMHEHTHTHIWYSLAMNKQNRHCHNHLKVIVKGLNGISVSIL